jgi:hypothetical protein
MTNIVAVTKILFITIFQFDPQGKAMKRGNIEFMEIPTKYTPVIDRLRLHKDPHYIEWKANRYWVMEHRWDDMIDDIHSMVNELKEQNKGKLPPDLIFREKNFQQNKKNRTENKGWDIFAEIIEIANDILIWIS